MYEPTQWLRMRPSTCSNAEVRSSWIVHTRGLPVRAIPESGKRAVSSSVLSIPTTAGRLQRSNVTSNTYWDWYIDHAFLLYPMANVIAPFMQSFEKFPPIQKPGSFTIGDAFKSMQAVPQQ